MRFPRCLVTNNGQTRRCTFDNIPVIQIHPSRAQFDLFGIIIFRPSEFCLPAAEKKDLNTTKLFW
jgi:hypothetical protein